MEGYGTYRKGEITESSKHQVIRENAEGKGNPNVERERERNG